MIQRRLLLPPGLVVSTIFLYSMYSGVSEDFYEPGQNYYGPKTADLARDNDMTMFIKPNRTQAVAENEQIAIQNIDTQSTKGKFTQNPPPQDVHFLIKNANICKNAPHLKYIVYVHSAPAYFVRRNALRSTWLNTTFFKEGFMQYVFIMGLSSSGKTQAKIEAEAEKYGDIVQGDFMDTYRNLTLKAILGLKWVTMFCQQARLLIKVDDDAFVNIFKLHETLKMYDTEKRTIICGVYEENVMLIWRNTSNCRKWCVDSADFPGRQYYPRYCTGFAYIFSMDLVPLLYNESKSTPFFWIDDVYITGLVPTRVKDVKYISIIGQYTLDAKRAMRDLLDHNKPPTYLFTHVMKSKVYMSMWQLLVQRITNDTQFTRSTYTQADIQSIE